MTQLIYLQPDGEEDFLAFETVALPAMKKYGGDLLLRLRPDQHTMIEGSMEAPYEVHLISFEDMTAVESFLQDKDRKHVLHLKEKSVKTSILYKMV